MQIDKPLLRNAPGGYSPAVSAPRPVLSAPDGDRSSSDRNAPDGAPSPLESDGRIARSERTKHDIIEALHALHADGDLSPTASRIAERAGVSRRTVWQHFSNSEELIVVAAQVDRDKVRRMTAPVPRDGPLADRITLLVRQRSRVFEAMAPGWRAARIWRHTSPQLRRDREQMLRAARTELEEIFAPELAQLAPRHRRPLVDALMAVTLWSFWESLRTDVGLTVARARGLVLQTVTALLREAGFPS